MLTRLKVSGFKNLVDVDVRFGPFTCVAGANGVGKSNLFDAICFLGALADRPLIDAALSVRDERGRSTDVRSLFHRVGQTYASEMSFEAEMIVSREGQDDLGQMAWSLHHCAGPMNSQRLLDWARMDRTWLRRCTTWRMPMATAGAIHTATWVETLSARRYTSRSPIGWPN